MATLLTLLERLLFLFSVNTQNFFTFDSQIYQQIDSLEMGSPLAPILANLYMEDFEAKMLKLFPEIHFWAPFTDDCFVAHTTFTERNLGRALKKMNMINPRIQFKCEKEQEGNIPFLDILEGNSSDQLSFDIYRKPTFCPRFIDGQSYHPISHKLSFLYSYIYRIFNFRLNDERTTQELNFYDQTCAQLNGITPDKVDQIFKKIKQKFELTKSTTVSTAPAKKQFVSLPYNRMNDIIAKRLRKFDIKVGFSVQDNLSTKLPDIKDKIEIGSKLGVYKVTCEDCNHVYCKSGNVSRGFIFALFALL